MRLSQGYRRNTKKTYSQDIQQICSLCWQRKLNAVLQWWEFCRQPRVFTPVRITHARGLILSHAPFPVCFKCFLEGRQWGGVGGCTGRKRCSWEISSRLLSEQEDTPVRIWASLPSHLRVADCSGRRFGEACTESLAEKTPKCKHACEREDVERGEGASVLMCSVSSGDEEWLPLWD